MTGPLERTGALAATTATVVAAMVAAFGAGYLVVDAAAPTVHSRYLPWITGRALGLAAYVALWALVLLGLAMRHPARGLLRHPHPEARLRAHAALAAATVLLVAGHLSSLALDSYAGVGWWGALVPGMSHYRRIAVGLGVGAFLAMLVVGTSAALAGRRGTRHWLGVHQISLLVFLAVWVHGVFAGSDTPALGPVYLVTGALVAVVAATRHLGGHVTWRRPAGVGWRRHAGVAVAADPGGERT
ncbi:MAG: hypothetical protein ACYCTE_12410 [Acidimicrobiales bacterium]